jgi:hypothetical protein
VSPANSEPGGNYGGTAVQQGTLPRAALVCAGILGVVAILAWLGFSRNATPPMDHYLRQGPAAAAAALKRDLQAEFPSGSQVTPLIRKLEGLGMRCTLASESRAQWECSFTVRAEARRSLQLRATIGTVGDKIVALDTTAIERAQ